MLLLILSIIIISLTITLYKNKELFVIINKRSNNTKIELIEDKWKKDFENRFKNHEEKSNLKMKEILIDLPNNSYIVDVGSHVGDTGLYLAKVLNDKYPHKNIKVIMIDPDKTKIKFIKKMARINKLNNILIKNYGVSNTKGKGKIKKDSHPGGWKINEKSNGDIKIDTIDNICKNMHISMLHIDVEGMEYKCLLGSKNIIKDAKYIMIELNHHAKRNNERQFLKKNNFIEINDLGISNENGNALFKNNNIK